jgi:hypothetical protein
MRIVATSLALRSRQKRIAEHSGSSCANTTCFHPLDATERCLVDIAALAASIKQDSNLVWQTAVEAWTNVSSRFVHAVFAAQRLIFQEA